MPLPHSLNQWQFKLSRCILDPEKDRDSPGMLMYRKGFYIKFKRLLSIYFPSLEPLLGETIWQEEIAIPFITENRPQLNIHDWVKRLPEWLADTNKEALSPLLVPLARFENLINAILLSAEVPLPQEEDLATARFTLQPHLHFFATDYPLLSYRRRILEGDTHFEIEKGPMTWIALHLNRMGDTTIEVIDSREKQFLESFSGRSLDEVFSFLEEHHPDLLQESIPKMGEWIERWFKKGLLSVSAQ